MRRMLFAAAVVALLTIAGEALADGGWGQWIQMDPPDHPSRRGGGGMAYDSESDRMILFGGYDWGGDWRGDTWAYDYNTDTWTRMSPANRPSPRGDVLMAYDSESDRVILFGGYDWSHLGDTWAYDYNTDTWEKMNPPSHPFGGMAPGLAYDAESDRVILFGGGGNGQHVDETWAYDYNTDTWELMHPPNHPAARRSPATAYHPGADRVMLFAGYYENVQFYDDTWAYDYNTDTWTQLNPADHPCARLGAAMVYHPGSNRVVLFGGQLYSSKFDDTWSYDYDTDSWTELSPTDHPSARNQHYMAYDAESDVIVLFAGNDPDADRLDDTWSFVMGAFRAPDDWLWPYWNWISIPGVPDDPDPDQVLGFDCGGRLWYWDKYGKWHQVYRPPFITFDLNVGDSYLLWLEEVPEPVSYVGSLAETPFEFKLGRMGWTWVGMPRLEMLRGWEFMCTVKVKYPSDETGEVRAAWEDWLACDSWLCWGWSWWDGRRQCPRTFTPYLPWHNVCHPWRGYRCYVRIGAAVDESDRNQVTLIWP